jgi:hypothetical protein
MSFIGSPRSGYAMKPADIRLLLIARKAGYGLAPRKWPATLTQIRRRRLRAARR